MRSRIRGTAPRRSAAPLRPATVGFSSVSGTTSLARASWWKAWTPPSSTRWRGLGRDALRKPRTVNVGLPLEPSEAARRLLDDVVQRVVAHIGSLAASPRRSAERRARSHVDRTRRPRGRRRRRFEFLFEKTIRELRHRPRFSRHPKAAADAAVVDLISAGVNRYVAFRPAPALVQLETNVLHWFARPRLPRREQVLTSGGSAPSRDRRGPAREAAEDSSRHSLRVRPGRPLDPEGRAPRACRRGERARSLGRRVPIAGSTPSRTSRGGPGPPDPRVPGRGTGAVDTGASTTSRPSLDFAEGVLAVRLIRLHRYFALSVSRPRGHERPPDADSIVLDPHKVCSCVHAACSSSRSRSTSQWRSVARACRPAQQPGLRGLADLPELSRDFRDSASGFAVKLLCGLAAFPEALDEKLDLAERRFDTMPRSRT